MSDFSEKKATPAAAAIDVAKHVNYALGMVLGVDDFTQEHAYLANRDQWALRDLIGYGTANGLRVASELIDGEPALVVQPGSAVDVAGRLIRICTAQCARLNPWLDAHRVSVAPADLPLPAAVTVHLTLCYRDCPTDPVPVPGEPCRSEDEAMAPSRIADDFTLELRLAAPAQREEDALRDFVHWLKHAEIVDADPVTSLADLAAAVRAAAVLTLDPAPPALSFALPPAPLRVPRADACAYFREAFRIWTTELRPLVHVDRPCGSCGCGDPAVAAAASVSPDTCILLATITIPLTPDLAVDTAGTLAIDESRRPYLLHLRMVQDWLVCGNAGLPGPQGAVGAQGPAGAQGAAGEQGPIGPQGPAGSGGGGGGATGPQGPAGAQGAVGPAGPEGQAGATGAQGPAGPGGFVVAAGRVAADGAVITSFGGLKALLLPNLGLAVYQLIFEAFESKVRYVVIGSALAGFARRQSTAFEVIDAVGDEEFRKLVESRGINPDGGVFVRVQQSDGQPGEFGFMVEISRYPQLTRPIGPVIGPIGPIGPVRPVEPVGPIGPVRPIDPVRPVGPVRPIDPGPLRPIDTTPIRPVLTPAQPIDTIPVRPVQPVVTPVQPGITPVRPVLTPAQPIDTTPVRPVLTPAQPVQPVPTPVRPVLTPAQPAQPVVTPVRPVLTPVQPVTAPVRPVLTPVRPVIEPRTDPIARPARPVVTGGTPVKPVVKPPVKPVARPVIKKPTK